MSPRHPPRQRYGIHTFERELIHFPRGADGKASINGNARVAFDEASRARRQAQKDLEDLVRRATTGIGVTDAAAVERALALVDRVVA